MFRLGRTRLGLSVNRGWVTVVLVEEKKGTILLKGCEKRPLVGPWEESGEELARKKELEDQFGAEQVFKEMFLALDVKEKDLGVALPDPLATVSFVELPSTAGGHKETEQMIRWRLKNKVPYDINEARLAYQILNRNKETEKKLLVLTVPEAVISPLETYLGRLSIKPKQIGIASFLLSNLFSRIIEPLPDLALIFTFGDYFTVMVFQGPKLAFYRSKLVVSGGEDQLPSIYTTFLYYNRLNPKTRIKKVFLFSTAEAPEEQRETLAEALQAEVELLDMAQALELDRDSPLKWDRLETLGPAVAAALSWE